MIGRQFTHPAVQEVELIFVAGLTSLSILTIQASCKITEFADSIIEEVISALMTLRANCQTGTIQAALQLTQLASSVV